MGVAADIEGRSKFRQVPGDSGLWVLPRRGGISHCIGFPPAPAPELAASPSTQVQGVEMMLPPTMPDTDCPLPSLCTPLEHPTLPKQPPNALFPVCPYPILPCPLHAFISL